MSVGELDIVLHQERMQRLQYNISNKGGGPKIQQNILHILKDVKTHQIHTLDGKPSTKRKE